MSTWKVKVISEGTYGVYKGTRLVREFATKESAENFAELSAYATPKPHHGANTTKRATGPAARYLFSGKDKSGHYKKG